MLHLHPSDAAIRGYLPDGVQFVAEEDGEIVGAFALTPQSGAVYSQITWKSAAAEQDAAVLHIFAVAPRIQRGGYATALVRFTADIARDRGKRVLRLDMLESNAPAMRLYRRCGFSVCGEAQLFYDNTGWANFFF